MSHSKEWNPTDDTPSVAASRLKQETPAQKLPLASTARLCSWESEQNRVAET